LRATEEIWRSLKPGGVAFVTLWEKLGFLEILDEPQRTVWPDVEPWKGVFTKVWLPEQKLRGVVESGWFAADRVKISNLTSGMVSARDFHVGRDMCG
jgi:hypothetical protein